MKIKHLGPQKALTQAYLILLMTLFLFFTGDRGYMKITSAKFRAFTLLACVYIAAMAAASLRHIPKGLSPAALLKGSSWTQRAAALYLALTWISAAASPHWPDTVLGVSRYEGALSITLYIITFMLVSAYGSADKVLLWVFAGAAALESLLCIVQTMGYNPFTLYPEGYNYFDAGTAYNGEYLGTIGNADLTAAFYCIAVPLLAYSAARARGRERLLLGISLALSAYAAVRMRVMAGYVGIGAGLLAALPAGLRERRRRVVCWALLGGAAAAGLIMIYAVDLPIGMLHEAHELLHGSADPSFGSGRVHIWSEVIEGALQRPILGHGPDTMIRGGLEPFSRYSEELGGTIVANIDTAHNEYLNIWYHQGIIALCSYIFLLAQLIRRWLRAAPDSRGALALGAGVTGYCAQAFFGFSMCITAPFFWAAAGLLESRAQAHRKEVKT